MAERHEKYVKEPARNRSAVKFVGLAVRDLGGLDQSAGHLLTEGVDIDASGVFRVPRIGVGDVNIEDERVVALGCEPVDIVFVIGDRGTITGRNGAVDRGVETVM